MTNDPTRLSGLHPKYEPSSNKTVEAIVKLRFPVLIFQEAILALAEFKGGETSYSTPELRAGQEYRMRLLALPPSELQELRVQNLAREEASLFFNQPGANADFEEWARFDFWSLEESVALLLGKSPKNVTLKKVRGYGHISKFPQTYESLLNLAQRSEVMTHSQRLRPADVLAWAQKSGAVEVPTELQRLITARTEQAMKPDDAQGPWTKERLAELQICRDQKGTKGAANAFNISEARVRKLLPRKPTKPKGNSVFNR